MEKARTVITYVCESCGREFEYKKDLSVCTYQHLTLKDGRKLTATRREHYPEEVAIILKVNHKDRKCLMEFPNEERIWVGFYELSMRNEL